MLAVCHGGLLNYTMNNHSKVLLSDKRNVRAGSERRCITKRFGNCEMREFRMSVIWNNDDVPTKHKNLVCEQEHEDRSRPVILMEEVELNDCYLVAEDEIVDLL